MPRRRRSSLSGLSESRDYDTSTDEYSNETVPSRGKPQQRNAANARERARMRVLSKAFGRLKTKLPWVPPDTKLSKLDTLRLATSYISHLQSILTDDHLNVPVHPRNLISRSGVVTQLTQEQPSEALGLTQDINSGVVFRFPEDTVSSSRMHIPEGKYLRPGLNNTFLVCPKCSNLVDEASTTGIVKTPWCHRQSDLAHPSPGFIPKKNNENPLDLSKNGPNGQGMSVNAKSVGDLNEEIAATAEHPPYSSVPDTILGILNKSIHDAFIECDDLNVFNGELLNNLRTSKRTLEYKTRTSYVTAPNIPAPLEDASWPFTFQQQQQQQQQPRLSEWLNADMSMTAQTDATSSSHEDDMEEDSRLAHHQGFQEAHHFDPYSQL